MIKYFKIEGMSCNHCVAAVQKSLSALNIKKIEVDIGLVKAEYDEAKITEEVIIKAIEKAGYKVVK